MTADESDPNRGLAESEQPEFHLAPGARMSAGTGASALGEEIAVLEALVAGLYTLNEQPGATG
jgi:hypothetical protein